MDIHSLFSSLETVLHQHTGMGYFVDLFLKSFCVLILMGLANLFSFRLAASVRHLFLSVGFIALFILPLFIGFLPKIQVPIATEEAVIVENTVTRSIVTLADKLDHAMISAWWKGLLSMYLALLVIQVLYILMGLVKVWSLSRSARTVENQRIHQVLNNLVLEEGLTVNVALLKSREVFSPVSWGLFSPEIILPEQAEHWDIKIIRNVLIHELSHIQRLDWLTNLIVRIAKAVYWYNPLAWYLARKLDEQAERACDDAVILNGHCQNEYASNLLEIANQARLGHLGNAVVQAIAGSFLGARVFSILDTKRRRQKTEVVWVVRGILVGCTVIAILASLRLVPLVNVTSIDPRASTAFSVIFIPRSEASSLVRSREHLYEYDQDDRRANSAGYEKQLTSASEQSVEDKPDVGLMAANNSASDARSSTAERVIERGPSLLEEYISSAGLGENKVKFESYVRDYTSRITRDVESGIYLDAIAVNDRKTEPEADEAQLVAIKTGAPEYPRKARRRGLEGYTVVEYDVDRNGIVRDPIIVESSPGAIFNRSALRAIQDYQFKPPEVDGQIVSLKRLQTRFVYQLKPG